MIIRSRAPLRLGFAGGGSDVQAFSDKYGGAVMNATINKYAFATVRENEEKRITFKATCQNQEWSGPLESILTFDGELDLFKAVYNRVINDHNKGRPIAITLSTYSEAPAGSGLGSSSTLVVAMVGAMLRYINVSISDYEIAALAYQIERLDSNLAGGMQDQYAATFGGFNFMEFNKGGGVLINPLRIKPTIISELESSLLLYFTGTSRESAKIIDQQTSNLESPESSEAVDAMEQVKAQSYLLKEQLLKGNIVGIADALNAGWKSKKQTAAGISNSDIDNLISIALKAGALAGKVSGAGGGGFIMFLVDPEKRSNVEQALSKQKGGIFNCSFSHIGLETWAVS
jgi:D-glycero-alpha-D-manno-heptose-7-phosphate kinase